MLSIDALVPIRTAFAADVAALFVAMSALCVEMAGDFIVLSWTKLPFLTSPFDAE